MDTLRAIVTYESLLGHNWRRRVALFDQSTSFGTVFAVHLPAIHDKFLPILFTNLHQVIALPLIDSCDFSFGIFVTHG